MANLLWALIPVVGPFIGAAVEGSDGGYEAPSRSVEAWTGSDETESTTEPAVDTYRGVRIRNLGDGDTAKIKAALDKVLDTPLGDRFRGNVAEVRYSHLVDNGNAWGAASGRTVTAATEASLPRLVETLGHEEHHIEVGDRTWQPRNSQQEIDARAAGGKVVELAGLQRAAADQKRTASRSQPAQSRSQSRAAANAKAKSNRRR